MVNVNRTRQDRKLYTFTMSSSDVAWSCVGAVFALTVFFLFGILVGRGYLPAEPGQTGVEQVEAGNMHGQLNGENATQAEAEVEPTVLKAEELAYPDLLDKPAEVVEASEVESQEKAEDGLAAKETKETGKAEDARIGTLPAPEEGEKAYHYTYQAAAFKDEAAAKILAGTLKERGVEATVRKGVTSSATWYRVQISFTGTPSQTRFMRDIAKEEAGQKPVMVSKKAVK